MDNFGDLIKQLREIRVLTQTQLAVKAGVSLGTIQKVEAAATCSLRRSNATALLNALHERQPLTPTELRAYLKLAGLESIADFADRYVTSESTKVAIRLRDLLAAVPAHERDAYLALADILQTGRAAEVVSFLRATATMLDRTNAESEQSFTVVHPPLNRDDGSTEQTFVEYVKAQDPKTRAAKQSSSPPAPKRKPAT
ncbi:MAG: helix-turn-helix transcriptional regulator [Phycisphaerales bacterium]